MKMKWEIIVCFFWLLLVAIGVKIIDIRNELKILNTNLVQINQTMQEQNKIFGTSPEEEILEVNND